jgi:hypothetical protein
MTVANTILAQLGGNRFAMMTGAKNFVGSADALMFSIGGGAKNKINKVRITLTPDDLYTVEFMKYSPSKFTVTEIAKVEGIYCDMLQETFTNYTGFFTSLRG